MLYHTRHKIVPRTMAILFSLTLWKDEGWQLKRHSVDNDLVIYTQVILSRTKYIYLVIM